MAGEIELLTSSALPKPNGHYSHAAGYGGLVFASGQLGRAAGMSDAEAGGIEGQARRALLSFAQVLAAAGTGVSRLLKVNIYLADIGDWPAVNRIYEEALGPHRPARAVIATGPLHFGSLIEVDGIAASP